jgi:hypothetical protein
MDQKSLQSWIDAVSMKIRTPFSSVPCPKCGVGWLEIAYLEIDGELVEAHVYCEVCGEETWVRKPSTPEGIDTDALRRYGGDA